MKPATLLDLGMFSIKTNQVQLEAGDDIMSPSSPRDGKLFRFADWLYGNRDQQFEFDKITIRMAPSIITRSEIELLGLSSPRFAFRANFGSHGFVTIRRRIIIEARIRIAHRSANYLGNLFPKEKDPDSPWIADCLLRIPDRFRDFHVISCDLRSDYGEDLLDSDSQGLVPFVTHVLFGGGLCAQAACFMALCLVQSEQIPWHIGNNLGGAG